MAFPPAHLLVGVGAAELARVPTPLPFWKVWLVGACFGVVPDIDTVILFLLGEASPHHGLYTHNLVAIGVVALLVWSFAGAHWALIAGTAYASHLVVDLLREGMTSVHLLWPLSSEPVEGLAPVFPTVPFDRVNGGFAFFGTDPWGKILDQILIGAAFFIIAVLLAAALRQLRAGRQPAQAYPPRRRRRRRSRRR